MAEKHEVSAYDLSSILNARKNRGDKYTTKAIVSDLNEEIIKCNKSPGNVIEKELAESYQKSLDLIKKKGLDSYINKLKEENSTTEKIKEMGSVLYKKSSDKYHDLKDKISGSENEEFDAFDLSSISKTRKTMGDKYTTNAIVSYLKKEINDSNKSPGNVIEKELAESYQKSLDLIKKEGLDSYINKLKEESSTTEKIKLVGLDLKEKVSNTLAKLSKKKE